MGKNSSPTRMLASFVANTYFDDLPTDIIHEAKRIILDQLSCMLGGYVTELGSIAVDYVRTLGGKEQATVVGSGEKTSCVNAAYANGRMGDALDASDTLLPAHIGNTAVAGALAACEYAGASGKELLTAVAVGYEVGARLAIAVGPPDLSPAAEGKFLPLDNYLPFGDFAAAGAAAKSLGLNETLVAHAFGITGANANTIPLAKYREYLISPLHKYNDYGIWAANGMSAVLLAEKGLTSFDTILDGDTGLWRIRGVTKCDFQLMTGQLGKKWYLLDNTYKAWPGCRWTHHPLTIFTKIIEEHGLHPEEIERVLVRSHVGGVAFRFKDKNPVGIASCEFNHPHACAMIALGVKRGPGWYTPKVMDDPKVKDFRQKVDVELDERSLKAAKWYKDGQMRKLPTSLIVYARGKTIEGYTDYAKGDPWTEETYFTDDELKDKFRDFTHAVHIASTSWQRQMEQVIETTYNMEKLEKVTELTKLLSM